MAVGRQIEQLTNMVGRIVGIRCALINGQGLRLAVAGLRALVQSLGVDMSQVQHSLLLGQRAAKRPQPQLYFFTMACISAQWASISATSLNCVRQRSRLCVGCVTRK